MFGRGISDGDIRHVLESGRVIRQYPDDTPYPSRLVLGWVGTMPLHVVAADNVDEHTTIIITVYVPDPAKWSPDFTRRTKR